MCSENCEKEMYVFLDFNGKLASDLFQSNVFLRIANLNESAPLIQINDCVFKGEFDHSVGTNLFFEENEDPHPKNMAFEKQTSIHLTHYVTQTKVIQLKQMKVKPKKAKIPEQNEPIELNLKWDYNTILSKLEDGSLKLEDIEKNEESHTDIQKEVNTSENKKAFKETTVYEEEFNPSEHEMVVVEAIEQEKERVLEEINPQNLIIGRYEKLKKLAFRPTKREVIQEEVMECEAKYKDSYDYHNLKCQILQPSDYFRENSTNIDEKTLSNAVDIDRCVLYKLIPPPSPNENYPILTNEEKERLLSLDNLDNLSLPARFYVLKNHVDDLEQFVNDSSEKVLKKRDEFGRTPLETLEIYKRLCDAVKLLIFQSGD